VIKNPASEGEVGGFGRAEQWRLVYLGSAQSLDNSRNVVYVLRFRVESGAVNPRDL